MLVMRWFWLLLLLIPVGVFAQSGDRVIQPGDRLALSCEEEASLNRDYEVTRDGFILVDFLGAVEVRGLTAEQAAERISRRLVEERILQRATIRIRILGETPPPVEEPEEETPPMGVVRVQGLVENPGAIAIDEGARLLDVLDSAGLTERSDLTSVTITRGEEVLTFDVSSGNREDDAVNPVLVSGDLITVSMRRPQATVSVLGAVLQPGQVRYETGLTVDMAIRQAGGFTSQADTSLIFVTRLGEPERQLDLQGADSEFSLAPGDVVRVGLLATRQFVLMEGQFWNAGPVEFRPGMTLTQAIREAGGPRPGARTGDIRLIRAGEAEGRVFDLEQIDRGFTGDPTLQPGDRIVAPGRSGGPEAVRIIAGIAILWFLFGR